MDIPGGLAEIATRYPATAAALGQLNALLHADAAREDELRQLLSYCWTQSDTQHTPEGPARLAYADVHLKLAAILDGER
jgi:hypothetical protein